MRISNHTYVPILKWRQGEYQALLRLSDAVKQAVVPLIEITPPDFDFETSTPTKTLDEHLVAFASRLQAKWGTRLALLDCSLLGADARMADGTHPMTYLCERATALGAQLVPVVTLESDAAYRQSVFEIDEHTGNGVALRCSVEEALETDFDSRIGSLMAELDVDASSLDVVLDLKSPNFEPEEGLVALTIAALTGATIFEQARSVTLAASSFPESMGEVTGPLQHWPRREWSLYRAVLASLPAGARVPAFGDYAIAGVSFAQGDMRILKPSATIRYTCNEGWIIAKGSNVRDNGFGQYRHCSGWVTQSQHYLGANFSPGSAYIEECRSGSASTGNLTTWRWVGTNHHITKVVADLANLHGS
jgi:hypothetical protein